MSLNLYQSEEFFFVQLNLSLITLQIKSQNFIDQGTKTLIIERNNAKIFEVKDDELLNQANKISEGPIFGIIGIMNIIGHNYLGIIKSAEDLGVIYGAHIYKISEVKLYPFNMKILHQIGQYLEELQKYLCDGFYFSYGYDLTCSRQRRIKFLQEKCKDPLKIMASDQSFFWNLQLYSLFRDQNIDCRWFTPLIQGYVGIVQSTLDGEELSLALISRRQHSRGGTRYNARGIDDQGNAANFVETEQMVKIRSFVYSYVLIRGSVPIFWEQKGMIEGVTLTRQPEMTRIAFHKHFNQLQDTYGQIYCVDLLSDTKKREIILTKEYVRQLYESDFKDTIKFLHFDFHHYCKGDKYQSLKVLMGKLGEGLHNFGYLIEDIGSKTILKFQQGVFRVNCLDSLDRTNVAQSKIGFMMLQKMLSKMGFDLERIFGEGIVKEGIAFANCNHVPIVQRFKHYWAVQGDFISKQYAGTTSTISKVSRDGKEGFTGKINHKMRNVQRYFINTLSENFQQNSIDIILGKHAKSILTSEMQTYLYQELRKRIDLFTQVKNIKLLVGTYNVGGIRPYESVDLSSFLLPFKENFTPDIYVLGFQEIVALNAKSIIMGNNQQNIKQWNELVLNNLKAHTGHEYVRVVQEDLVGLYIGVYTKKEISHSLKDIATSKVKLGMQGNFGNKGATMIRFLYKDTSFCFINCHLESGTQLIDAKRRLNSIREILENGFIKERGTQQSNYSIKNHEIQVLFGDLNYRINLDNEMCRDLIQYQDYDELYKNDEFQFAQQDNKYLKGLKEGHITFDPTYKYDENSDQYDTSSKNRVPSWTDRIIYNSQDSLQQVYYGRSELKYSDHRPVFSLFEVKVRTINEEMRYEIEQKILEKYRALNPSQQHQKSPKKMNSDLTPVNQRKMSRSLIRAQENAVEPHLGDFALQDNSLIPKKKSRKSPQVKAQSFVTTKDPLILDEIVRNQSVLIGQAEVDFHTDHTYAEVLNQRNMESERDSPFRKVQESEGNEDKFLDSLDQNKVTLPLNTNEEEKQPSRVKKIQIFNCDSDEEEEEKNGNKKGDESPFKIINGKLKGVHIEEFQNKPKPDLFGSEESDNDNEEDNILRMKQEKKK